MNRIMLTLCLLATLAGAQERMWRVEVQVVRVPAAHSRLGVTQLYEAEEWADHLRSGHVQILESGTVLGTLNRESLAHAGAKIPIGYPDPRTGSYQVRYIDSGWKIEAKVSETPTGRWLVDCRAEHAALAAEGPTAQPEQDVFVVNSVNLLRPGQVAVIGCARGRISAQYVKKVLPKEAFAEGDTVMIALSVRKP